MSWLARLFKKPTSVESQAAEPEIAPPDEQTQHTSGDEHAVIAGDRGVPLIHRARSLQSRMTGILAMALFAALGLGLLGYYYARVYSNRAAVQQEAQRRSQLKGSGEMHLPPLGPVEMPVAEPPPVDGSAIEQILGPAPVEPPPDIPAAWLRPAQDADEAFADHPQVREPRPKSSQELALERRLSGPAFSQRAESLAAAEAPAHASVREPAVVGGITMGDATSAEPSGPTMAGAAAAANSTELSRLLTPTVTQAAQANVLPTQRLLLPKGAFIDCTLETALNSSLPSMPTCITATDTFSADGKVVLLERGTKLIGESVGTVRRGTARIFVVWSEARTPTGVVIPLSSPGTDELGRSGLPGKVNRHFWERFGAALLVSIIDGAVQTAAQSGDGDATIINNPESSQEIMTEILKNTIDIPPTVDKHNGDRIQILVARDVDFRTVYELRTVAADR